jgi:hypothetical protein
MILRGCTAEDGSSKKKKLQIRLVGASMSAPIRSSGGHFCATHRYSSVQLYVHDYAPARTRERRRAHLAESWAMQSSRCLRLCRKRGQAAELMRERERERERGDKQQCCDMRFAIAQHQGMLASSMQGISPQGHSEPSTVEGGGSDNFLFKTVVY